MKILVVSDSHGDIPNLVEAYEKEQPDIIFSAGDHSTDIKELMYIYNNIKTIVVRGNCDCFDRDNNDDELFGLENINFFLTHGHKYGVKNGYEILIEKAKENNAQIVIFGHTHYADLIDIEGLILFNPGALKDGRYGVLKIDNKNIKFEHKSL